MGFPDSSACLTDNVARARHNRSSDLLTHFDGVPPWDWLGKQVYVLATAHSKLPVAPASRERLMIPRIGLSSNDDLLSSTTFRISRFSIPLAHVLRGKMGS